MRAAVLHAPLDLRIEDRATPPLAAGQVKVRIGAGGICGSDLHYYLHGGFGVVRLKEPMILGHEIAGAVDAIGPGVDSLGVGQRVAVNPSLPCGVCRFCRRGLQHHCLDMRFFGSAMRMPHVQGGFRDELVCEAVQAVPVADGVSLSEAAFAEPLAVCLHAVSRAGPLLGRRVLVAGAGPIGVLTVIAARLAGAAEIVATDILDEPLAVAAGVGADRTVNIASDPGAMKVYEADKGYFDVMFEASGNAKALLAGLSWVGPQGVIVQIGQGGEAPLPISGIVSKEIAIRGSFRFNTEFSDAVHYIGTRRVDIRPLLTEIVDLSDATRAFELAADKRRSMKVHLSFA
jgi:L-idonate 5-dehydrogenase